MRERSGDDSAADASVSESSGAAMPIELPRDWLVTSGAQHLQRTHERGGVRGQGNPQLGGGIRGDEREACSRVLLHERAHVLADAVEPRFPVAPVLGHDARRGVDHQHDVGVGREGLRGSAGNAGTKQERDAGEHQ